MRLFRNMFANSKLRKMAGVQSIAHSTPGGITPHLHKSRSLRSKIMAIPIPPHLLIPLQQQQGTASAACVKAGDRVLKYQKIADATDSTSLDIYAPSSGVVSMIQNHTTINPAEKEQLCIFIDTDGKDEELAEIDAIEWQTLTREELLPVIRNAGICGMGGAGFPLPKKMETSSNREIHTLIVNAAECEPFITADQALIRERSEAVIQGAEILQYAINAKHCVIAIERSKGDAIAALSKSISHSSVEIVILDDKYPAGGERQVIQAVSGKELQANKLPADAGIHLQNVGSVYAVYRAVAESKPCISRITTLTGEALQTPKNFEALIGTPVSFLFDLCGIDKKNHAKTVVGGSLMGIELMDTSAPVMQSSNCLIAGSLAEFPDTIPEQPCIRCGFCAEACPAGLLPQQLLSYSRSEDAQQLEDHGLFDCIECGACSYVCPSKIPLVQYYRNSKEQLALSQEVFDTSKGWQARFQDHQYRIKKLKDEAEPRTATGYVFQGPGNIRCRRCGIQG